MNGSDRLLPGCTCTEDRGRRRRPGREAARRLSAAAADRSFRRCIGLRPSKTGPSRRFRNPEFGDRVRLKTNESEHRSA